MKKLLIAVTALILCFAMTALASGSVWTTGKVNLRRSAGLDGDVITSIPEDTWLEYTDTEYDARGVKWFYVEYNGRHGWISSNYTDEKDYSYDGYVQGDSMASSGYVTLTGKSYIRSYASLDATIYTTVPDGERLYYSDTDFDDRGIRWVYVSYHGYSGWLSTRYTKEYGEWDAGSSGSSGTVVATGSVNIRSEPSLDGYTVGSMPEGASASYQGQKEYDTRGVIWYKIKYKGTTGWVSEKYSYLK